MCSAIWCFRWRCRAHRFVRAVEFRPGAASIVHHAVISLDRTRAARRRDGLDGQPGYDGMITQGAQNPDGHFLGWTPGRGPIVAPDGMPWRLDPGTDLIVQLHLLPQKTAQTVQPSVGLFFTDTPPRHVPMMIKLGSKAIDIPAGERRYEITDSYVLPVDRGSPQRLSSRALPRQRDAGDGGAARWHDASAAAASGTGIFTGSRTIATPRRSPCRAGRRSRCGSRTTIRRTTCTAPRGPLRPVVYGPESSDEMGDLWLQVLPRSAADASTLVTARSPSVRRAATSTAAELLATRVPENARNQLFLGGSYVEAGRAAEAVPHLEHALRLDPRSASAHNYLGRRAALAGPGARRRSPPAPGRGARSAG